jgi:membrane protein DedA with SNARE-associated domain
MPDVLQFLLGEHGSLMVIVVLLIVAGLGLPIPEDIMLFSAGVLVHRGEISYLAALVGCAVGVFIGDTTIFLIARRLGPSALGRRPLRWLITPERRELVEDKFARYGNVIVFMGRHMAGLRAPIFAMAGMHQMPITKFWLWDGLGLCVSAPVVIGIGWWFADNLDKALEILGRFHWAIGGLLLAAVALFVVWRKVRRTKPVHEH